VHLIHTRLTYVLPRAPMAHVPPVPRVSTTIVMVVGLFPWNSLGDKQSEELTLIRK
jgi:hypothetical protein